MALTTSAMVALGLAAAGAGASYYNTERTAKRQDQQTAESLRNQGAVQRRADAAVNAQVEQLKGSNADAARRQSLDSFMGALRANQAKTSAGLRPGFGSEAFRGQSAAAAQGVEQYGQETADMLSRIDAPSQQRQAEAFGYGNLTTDLGMLSRESGGQRFIDELRLRAIRRNSGLDALSSMLTAGAGAAAGAGGGAGGASTQYAAPSGMTYTVPTSGGVGWHNAYGAGR